MDISSLVQQIGTIAAALAGAFLALDKTKSALISLSNTKPILRKTIRADLELFKLMVEADPGYEELKNHIKNQVQVMIKGEEKKDIVSRNWLQFLIGLLMAGGFGYWTYYIFTSAAISDWWIILTGWMAFAGFGFLVTAFSESKTEQTNSGDTKTLTSDE
jgi:hypothetical protein